MNSTPIKIKDNIFWIGVLDNEIVTFDIVMETNHGTTYNSYFIDADKKAIIDTVKETFQEEYIEKISTLTKLEDIEVIIVNHTEPDHSGNVANLIERCPQATVYGSGQAINFLNEIINKPFRYQKVKHGEEISLGNKTLKVIGAPNLHWPDTIYTYLKEDKMLFTCDSFGEHFCHEKMFDDLVGDYSESFKYYFDVILKPFSRFMVKAIDKIKDLDLEIICPGHGPILRSNWEKIVQQTENMSEQYLADCLCEDNNILITYVSAYGYTRQMAEEIKKGISEVVDYKINVVDLENILLGDLEELIVKSNAILVGSPTINQNIVLPVYKMFSLINPIRDKSKKAATFGSYGWSGEGVKLIEDQLKALKMDVVLEGISARFSPKQDKAENLIDFGRKFAAQLL